MTPSVKTHYWIEVEFQPNNGSQTVGGEALTKISRTLMYTGLKEYLKHSKCATLRSTVFVKSCFMDITMRTTKIKKVYLAT